MRGLSAFPGNWKCPFKGKQGFEGGFVGNMWAEVSGQSVSCRVIACCIAVLFREGKEGTGLHSPCPVDTSVVPICIDMYMLRRKLGRYFKCVPLPLFHFRQVPCMHVKNCLFGVLERTIHIITINLPFPCPVLPLLSTVLAACSGVCILLSVLWLTLRSLQSRRQALLKCGVLVRYLYCSQCLEAPLC